MEEDVKNKLEALGVSRETIDKLKRYVELIQLYSRSQNLVSKNDVNKLWERHIFDCAFLLNFVPQKARSFLDIGSGAGFPALVLAICFEDNKRHYHLVEINNKKAAFLRRTILELNLNATVWSCRIENLTNGLEENPDVITSRAVADLPQVLKMAEKYIEKGSVGLFQCGEEQYEQLETVKNNKKYSVKHYESLARRGFIAAVTAAK